MTDAEMEESFDRWPANISLRSASMPCCGNCGCSRICEAAALVEMTRVSVRITFTPQRAMS